MLNPRASEHEERRHDNVHVSSFPFYQLYSGKMEMTSSLLHLEIKLYCTSVLFIAESKPFHNVLCLSRAHDGDFG